LGEIKYISDSNVNASFFYDIAEGAVIWNDGGGGTPKRITSPDVEITGASFICYMPTSNESGETGYVNIIISAKDKKSTGAESAQATIVTKIFLGVMVQIKIIC